MAAETSSFLVAGHERLACRAGFSVVTYGGTTPDRTNEFPAQRVLTESGSATVGVAGAVWSCSHRITHKRGGTTGLSVTFRLDKGSAESTGISVWFKFGEWSAGNYVLIPAVAYNGNRFRCVPMHYPPLFRDLADHRPDAPITITNIPRLSLEPGPSRIQQTTGDPSTPAMGFFAPSRSAGFLLLTGQQTRFGNSGLTIEENTERTKATFAISAPCVREGKPDKAASWKAGDKVTLELELCFFEGGSIQSLHDLLARMRKDLTGPTRYRPILPFQGAWDLLEEKYNRDNWEKTRGYYSVGMRENYCQDWQLGWVGGCMATLPLLLGNDETSRTRAMTTLNTILTRSQAPSGFFYGAGFSGNWVSDCFDKPHPHNMHMVRKSGDGLFFFIKHFMLIEAQQGRAAVRTDWEAAVRRLADAFVGLWKRSGQFGQFVNVETGELQVGGSTSGAIVPAALALAHRWFADREYLDVAEASARLYLERDVRAGVTTGGPGEILQAPDSESAFAMLESFVTLFESTGKDEWRAAACDMARQCASWVVSYDYTFPPKSLFGTLDMRTTGAVYANAQNKHGAPGICTLSGDSLLRLYRATGDVFFIELLRDIAHNITQYVSRTDRSIGAMPPGWINERVNLSDWEGPAMVGGIFYGSTWAEVSVMLTWLEIPGIYVVADTGSMWVFDNVTAVLDDSNEQSATLTITNPTKFRAAVRVVCETSAQLCAPLPVCAVPLAHTVELAPGERKTVEVRTRPD